MSTPERALELGHHIIDVAPQTNDDGEVSVRVRVSDPNEPGETMWIDLAPSDALVLAQHMMAIAERMLWPDKKEH